MSMGEPRGTGPVTNPAVRASGQAPASQSPVPTSPAPSRPPNRLSVNGRSTTRRTALSLPPGLPLAEWSHLGRQIFVIADSSAWWLGDWLIYGRSHYPDRYKRALAETSFDYQTLRNYAWVAGKFHPSRRRDKLSFQHHGEVAGMSVSEQDAWLTRAERGRWTRSELRKQIRASRRVAAEAAGPSLVQMSVVPERRVRWQKAAEAVGLELMEWMVLMLDEAAEEPFADASG